MNCKNFFIVFFILLINLYSSFLFSQDTSTVDTVENAENKESETIVDSEKTDALQNDNTIEEQNGTQDIEKEQAEQTEDEEEIITEENTETKESQASEEEDTEKEEPSIITIEHALKTTYMQDEENDTDAIRFEGEVQVSVEKEESKTTIYADFVDFDRNRNSLYAEGSVIMEQSKNGEVTERLTAYSLLFDTNSLEGYFNQGRVVQEQQESLNLSGDTVLIVSSELFAKGSSNAVAFKNGNLTFCDDENPHWEIKASRIWLLPGNEFAFANALLFVGPVPVMYFPFFYYPKDEVVFNPAFGFRTREGFFVQTTTYIIGRKPLGNSDSDDEENDIGFNFMQQSELKEQELQGLILRNLDENATMPENHLKIMADYYTTLGGMVGIDGHFEPNDAIQDINFNLRFGFSNITFSIEEFPLYISYNNGQKYPDYGWFLGNKLPFRYAGNFETNVSIEDFSLSVDIPLYSDPWFDTDFSDRQESMDWIDFFLSGTLIAPPTEEGEEDEENTDVDSITGFSWNFSASYKPDIPSIKPWVSSLSLSALNSSVVFTTQDAPSSDFENENIQTNSPNREFFYPSQIKPIAVELDIAGSLFHWPITEYSQTKTIEQDSETNNENIQAVINILHTPEDFIIENEAETNEIKNVAETEDEDPEKFLLSEENLPHMNESTIASTTQNSDITYSLQYNINPEFSTLYKYSGTTPMSNTAIAPNEIDVMTPESGQLFFKSSVGVDGNFEAFSSLLSIKNSVDFYPEYQTHQKLSSDYYTEEQKDSKKLSDYKAFQLDVKNSNTLSVKPLISTTMFKNSSINWNTAVNIVQTEFTGTVEEPEWEYNKAEWDDESITSHNLNAVFEATQNNFYQRLTLETNLPPLVDSYTGKLDFGFPFGNITGTTGYKQENKDSDEWIFQPFVQTASFTLFEKTKDGENNKHAITLRQTYEYDIEEDYSDALTLSAAWQGLEFSYNMRYGNSYTLDVDSGWEASEDKSFLPHSMALKWNVNNFEIKDKEETVSIKPGISTTVSWDMIIPTNSYFTFSPRLSLEIKDFLVITFSSESQNDQLVRYLQKGIGFTPEIPGEQNVFVDLWNSFAFWDEEKRTSSGFKIESFNLEIEHDLHDWTLKSEFEIEPRILTDDDGTKRFDYSPYFTLAVLWKPMAGIKTTIEDEYGEFTLNP